MAETPESPPGPPSIPPPPPGPPVPPPSPPRTYPQYAYARGRPPVVVRTNGFAIGALVCGLVSFALPILLSVPAIVLGLIGRHGIDRSGGNQRGRGMAISGIVLGTVTLIVTSAFIAFVAFEAGQEDGGKRADEREQVVETVGRACRNAGVPVAGAYRGDGPFHMVLVGGKGQEIDWTRRNASWRAETVADAELVACVTARRTLIQSCPYTGGNTVERYRTTVRVRVLEARNRRVVDTFTLTDDPRQCHFSEWFYTDTVELEGRVPFKRVDARLTEIAERPTVRR